MGAKVLVVDDEPDIRQLIAHILQGAGHTVTLAGNGQEGLAALEDEMYDLVVLDIMMPDMDGWEVCRQIKSHSRTRHIPVLILTVRSQPLDRIIGLEVVHAEEYLTKPFELKDLLAAVTRLVSTGAPSAG